MFQKIKVVVWAGNQKWFTIGGAVVVVVLMLVFGENTEWTAE